MSNPTPTQAAEQGAGHTAGPWKTHWFPDVTGYPVFYIHGMSGDQKRDCRTLEANARLIAAAPDLLEACVKAAKTFRRYEAMHADKGTVEGMQKAGANAASAKDLEAAIARAQGGAA